MTPERRQKKDSQQIHKIVSQEWTVFFHDELRRLTTVPEMVAACRQFKTRLSAKLAGMGCEDWIENTMAFIDIKIDELVALAEALAKRKAEPDVEVKPTLSLKKVFDKLVAIRKRKPKPADPAEGEQAFPG